MVQGILRRSTAHEIEQWSGVAAKVLATVGVIEHHFVKGRVSECWLDADGGQLFEDILVGCPILQTLKIAVESVSDGFLPFIDDGACARPGSCDGGGKAGGPGSRDRN